MRPLLLATSLLATSFLGACTQVQVGAHLLKKADADNCVAEGSVKVGKPYIVDGIRYVPMDESLGYAEKGIASWYGEDFHGKASANGECYNMYAFTAAHKTLPLPTIARVTNLENNRSVVVKINDRGPFVRGRIIDLSYAAAQSLDVIRYGTAPVMVEAIGGPHHQAGGYSGGYYKAPTLVGKDIPAERLASVGTGGVAEEPLAPLTKPTPQQLAESRIAALHAEKAAKPEYEDRIVKDTKQLRKSLVYVQVGAFSSLENATKQKDDLHNLYDTAAISPIESNGQQLHRVRAGPFHSVADADVALAKIVEAGFSQALIKVDD